MNGKVTHITFGGERIVEAPQLHQYDYGQILVFDDIPLPEVYEVLFSNNVIENAKTVIGTSEGVAIPDELLITGKNVLAWIFLHDGVDDGETEYVVRIPIRCRSKLADLTVEEHSIVSDLIALVQSMQTDIDSIDAQIAEINEQISGLSSRIDGVDDRIDGLEERIVALENRIPALGGWKTQGGGQNG